ncbi:hypothetical protein [Clostridium hydrogenum]|uniref:hypothetical protein n=1 Tax=Clostridium hydrogenum TaxID=2855764 RepID=UPI001F2E4A74|nr:hypothetical protein [Clostridium hydrogenum]
MSILNRLKIADFSRFRLISVLAYVFLACSIRSFNLFKDMKYFWILCALIGGVLLVIKNNSIENKKYKNKIIFFDVLFLIVSDILYFYINIPFIIKDVLFIAMIVIYLLKYFRLLFNGKLLKKD